MNATHISQQAVGLATRVAGTIASLRRDIETPVCEVFALDHRIKITFKQAPADNELARIATHGWVAKSSRDFEIVIA